MDYLMDDEFIKHNTYNNQSYTLDENKCKYMRLLYASNIY